MFYQWRESFHSRAAVSANCSSVSLPLGLFFAPVPLAFALARAAGVSSWSFLRRESSIAAAAAGLEAAPGVSAALVPP